MAYLSEGQVLEGRSWWSVAAITDLFWALLNFIVLFAKTLVSPGFSKDGNTHATDYRRHGRVDRGRKIGRIGGGGGGGGGGSGPPGPPPMGGG